MKKIAKKTHKRLLQGISATLGLILALFTIGHANDHTTQASFTEFNVFDRANADSGGGGDGAAANGDSGGDGAAANGI